MQNKCVCAKQVQHMQAMRLPSFRSEIYTIVKPNVAAIRKTLNIDFERHYLSCADFQMATESALFALRGRLVAEVARVF